MHLTVEVKLANNLLVILKCAKNFLHSLVLFGYETILGNVIIFRSNGSIGILITLYGGISQK